MVLLEASKPKWVNPMIFDMALTHLGSEASNFDQYIFQLKIKWTLNSTSKNMEFYIKFWFFNCSSINDVNISETVFYYNIYVRLSSIYKCNSCLSRFISKSIRILEISYPICYFIDIIKTIKIKSNRTFFLFTKIV